MQFVPVITVMDLDETSLVGVEFTRGGRAFVMKVRNNEWILANLHSANNEYNSKVVEPTIIELLKSCKADIEHVVLFDTVQERAEWLIKAM